MSRQELQTEKGRLHRDMLLQENVEPLATHPTRLALSNVEMCPKWFCATGSAAEECAKLVKWQMKPPVALSPVYRLTL